MRAYRARGSSTARCGCPAGISFLFFARIARGSPIRDIADWPNDIAINGHGRGTRPKPDLLRWLVCGWLNPRHGPTKACHEDWLACLSHTLKDGQAGGLESGDSNLIHKQLLTLELTIVKPWSGPPGHNSQDFTQFALRLV